MGCGKSTLSSYYKGLGHFVLSADELIKDLYEDPDVVSEVITAFGFSDDLDGKELIKTLSEQVFKNKEKLGKLENILHPKLRKRVEYLKTNSNALVGFYDVPLLFEKSMESMFDYIICVGLSEEIQVQRIRSRNSWSEDQIQDRIANQFSISEKKKKSDFYIDNGQTLEDLHRQAKEILSSILNRA